jgi:hypothetical protein
MSVLAPPRFGTPRTWRADITGSSAGPIYIALVIVMIVS